MLVERSSEKGGGRGARAPRQPPSRAFGDAGVRALCHAADLPADAAAATAAHALDFVSLDGNNLDGLALNWLLSNDRTTLNLDDLHVSIAPGDDAAPRKRSSPTKRSQNADPNSYRRRPASAKAAPPPLGDADATRRLWKLAKRR